MLTKCYRKDFNKLESGLAWLPSYFKRIGNPAVYGKNLSDLVSLHAAHVNHIAFDMTDGFLTKDVPFSINDVVRKIVYSRRGGGCTQMNGLFAEMLCGLGFDVSRTLAKTFINGVCKHHATHMVLVVTIDGKRWLCDVGFGFRGPLYPLSLDIEDKDSAQMQGCHTYRVRGLSDNGWLIEYLRGDRWQGLLEVIDDKYDYEEFRVTHFYNTHAPQSIFAERLICARPHLEGGDLLQDCTFTRVRNNSRISRKLGTLAELVFVLEKYFDVKVSSEMFRRLPVGLIGDVENE